MAYIRKSRKTAVETEGKGIEEGTAESVEAEAETGLFDDQNNNPENMREERYQDGGNGGREGGEGAQNEAGDSPGNGQYAAGTNFSQDEGGDSGRGGQNAAYTAAAYSSPAGQAPAGEERSERPRFVVKAKPQRYDNNDGGRPQRYDNNDGGRPQRYDNNDGGRPQRYDNNDGGRQQRPHQQQQRRPYERNSSGGGSHYSNYNYQAGINQAGMSAGFNINNIALTQGPLPELPKNLTSMPGLYGNPEPKGDDAGPVRLSINALTRLSMIDLRELATCYGITHEDLIVMRKQEIIFTVLNAHTARGGIMYAYGSLEIMNDGYGFLRNPQNSYLPGPDDIYVSPSQIRLFALKTGDTVYGQIRGPKDGERFFAMLRIETVNYDDPSVVQNRVPFENLTPLYPDEKLNLETKCDMMSTRIINLFCPIGKGQRSIIVAPPRTGKTIMMQQVANAITENHPEVYLIVLLIDERPEEVTDMERSVHAEVISSTFDEQSTRHVQVAEMVLEKAKRLVEHKRDVVILLDSVTRLARAYNQTVPTSGKILSGGVDSNALHKPKRFFGAARNVEEGGSLTIISTALVETGSRMDEVIFEEFKGTGNMEINLDRKISDRRIFPAINIKKSGTRKEELLLTDYEMKMMWVLRKFINPMEDVEVIEILLDRMKKSKDNEALLKSMNTGSTGGD